jgi:hypothetical protein
MVVVVVPPDGVRMCETTGEVISGMVAVVSHVDHDELSDDGELVNDDPETDGTDQPDSVTDGVLDAGAGVYTVVVEPDGVV